MKKDNIKKKGSEEKKSSFSYKPVLMSIFLKLLPKKHYRFSKKP